MIFKLNIIRSRIRQFHYISNRLRLVSQRTDLFIARSGHNLRWRRA